MTLIIWFGGFIVAVIALLLIRKFTPVEFVSHAALLHKTWSVRINAIAFTIGGWLVAWRNSPEESYKQLVAWQRVRAA